MATRIVCQDGEAADPSTTSGASGDAVPMPTMPALVILICSVDTTPFGRVINAICCSESPAPAIAAIPAEPLLYVEPSLAKEIPVAIPVVLDAL